MPAYSLLFTVALRIIHQCIKIGLDFCLYKQNSRLFGCADMTVELRPECAEIMKRQRHGEPAGRAKITKAYNLPCRYIIHTVGPIINNTVTCKDEEILTSCYLSCLELAEKYHIKSIAFCCISTGEYRFPNKTAANIAVNTVISYKQRTGSKIEVIFNVFKDHDYRIYRELLG